MPNIMLITLVEVIIKFCRFSMCILLKTQPFLHIQQLGSFAQCFILSVFDYGSNSWQRQAIHFPRLFFRSYDLFLEIFPLTTSFTTQTLHGLAPTLFFLYIFQCQLPTPAGEQCPCPWLICCILKHFLSCYPPFLGVFLNIHLQTHLLQGLWKAWKQLGW